MKVRIGSDDPGETGGDQILQASEVTSKIFIFIFSTV